MLQQNFLCRQEIMYRTQILTLLHLLLKAKLDGNALAKKGIVKFFPTR